MTLTTDQEKALSTLSKFFEDKDALTCTIKGSAGTGKTTLIEEAINLFKTGPAMAVAAPTHKAKQVIKEKSGCKNAYTVAELIGLGVDKDLKDFDPNKPEFKPKNEPKIQFHKRFFIDEASMLNRELFNFLVELAELHKVKLVFIGDGCQLPPVETTLNRRNTAKENLQSNALILCEYEYELKQIVRQNPTNPLSYLLMALRNDINAKLGQFDSDVFATLTELIKKFNPHLNLMTLVNDFKDSTFKWCLMNIPTGQIINDEGWTLIRDLENFKLEIATAVRQGANLKAMAYTNAEVSKLNEYIRGIEFPGTAEKVVPNDTLMCYRTVTDNTGRNPLVTNSEEYTVLEVRSNTFLVGDGEIFTRECLLQASTSNKKVLVNILEPVSYGRYNRAITDLLWAAKKDRNKWKDYYTLRDKFIIMDDLNTLYNNQALPYKDMDYGYAITTHKSQGSTYDCVAVHGQNIALVKHYAKDNTEEERSIILLMMMYVALSRASKQALLYF